MNWTKAVSELRTAHLEGRFAEFVRGTLAPVSGYLIESSPDWILVDHFEWNSFDWNGKCIVWKQTISGVHCFGRSAWPIRAARHFPVTRPVSPKLSFRKIDGFLKHHIEIGSIIQVEQEFRCPGEMYLCELLAIRPEDMLLRSYDRVLKTSEDVTMSYQDITLITFLDRYSEAATYALGKKLQSTQREPAKQARAMPIVRCSRADRAK